MPRAHRIIVVLACFAGCAAPGPAPRGHNAPASPPGSAAPLDPQPRSLLGRPLEPLPPGPQRDKAEADLAAARAALEREPDNPDKIVWVGRRLGYLWRMNEAVEVFTQGLRRFPQFAPFYRHRGHRYLSVRRFDLALGDLRRAAELIEGRPDEIELNGMPNARNLPLTTLGFNVWYHLALAHYLRGELVPADEAWRRCSDFIGGHADNYVAVADWRYLTLRRLGRDAEAQYLVDAVSPRMDIIENRAYQRRCLMYAGQVSPEHLLDLPDAGDVDRATLGYGLGMWRLLAGRTDEAAECFRRVVADGPWPAFAVIAAEAELLRLGAGRPR